MSKAFIETTIVADALLKRNKTGDDARAALARFSTTLVPQYAIKELKAGVLRNYVWLHTKAMTTSSYDEVMDAITRMWGRPYLSGTAWRALTDFESSISSHLTDAIATKYPEQRVGEIKRAELEVWLRTLIFRAWRKRKRIGSWVSPLCCYREVDPTIERTGLINIEPTACGVDDCCLREEFKGRKEELGKLVDACERLPRKPESGKRKTALQHLYRTPNRNLDAKSCQALGDAVFVLQCPRDAVLLTTNLKDHEPLAEAIGITVQNPATVLSQSD